MKKRKMDQMYCGSEDACAFAAFVKINVFLVLEKVNKNNKIHDRPILAIGSQSTIESVFHKVGWIVID